MKLRTVLPPVIVAVLGLGALSGVQDTGFRERIESDLTERAQGALSAARLYGADVTVTGRDADVTAPTDLEAIEAAAVVNEVEGIRAAVAVGPYGPVAAGERESSLSQRSPAGSVEAADVGSAEATVSPEPTATSSADEAEDTSDDESDEPRRAPTHAEREEAQEDLVEIPNITFVTDSARLTKDGRRVVREAAEVLEEHPEVEVRVEGHTDSRGSEAHNRRLSERRADEVVDQLVEHGVDSDRLTSKGFGEEDPLVVPKTFADLEKNRRVEFIVQN